MVANADPSSVEAKPAKYPNANVLTEGFRTPIPRVPENVAAVRQRQGEYFRTLCPRNYFHAFLADDVALMTLRLERCARIERRERDRIALRAEFFWDDDRKAEAEEVGARLAIDPARTVERLRRTPQGCDWLIRRWALLAREANLGRGWDEAQKALAFDLLGTPEGFRKGTPGGALDLDGEATDEGPVAPASVARREIAALREHRVAVGEADALDRALAMADMTEQTTPELRRLRRYENALLKRMRWDMHQLEIVPRYHTPNPNLAHLYDPEPSPPEAQAQAAPEPVVPTPAPEPVPDPEPESPPPVAKEPGPARRPEPRLLKDRARREAKKRRTDRLDN